jgi:hypothetical protein
MLEALSRVLPPWNRSLGRAALIWRESPIPPVDIVFAAGVPQDVAPISLPAALVPRAVLVAYDIGLVNTDAGSNGCSAVLLLDGATTAETAAEFARQSNVVPGAGALMNIRMPYRAFTVPAGAHVLSLSVLCVVGPGTTDIAGFGAWARLYLLEGAIRDQP